jgi:hypothetical protein
MTCTVDHEEFEVWERDRLVIELGSYLAQLRHYAPDALIATPIGQLDGRVWRLALRCGLDALCNPEPCLDTHLLHQYQEAMAVLYGDGRGGTDPEALTLAQAWAEATVGVLQALLLARLGHPESLSDILAATLAPLEDEDGFAVDDWWNQTPDPQASMATAAVVANAVALSAWRA